MIADTLALIIAACGVFFVLVAAIGTLRFPDIYCRMHAATKAGSLGLGLLLAAIAIRHPEPAVIVKCALIILFLFLTNPIAAHMISRAAYLHKAKLWQRTGKDELKGKYSVSGERLDG